MVGFGSRAHDVVAGPTTPEELGRACARLGVRNVQLALGMSFPQWSAADAVNPGMGAHIRRVLAAHDVDIAIMGCYVNMIHPDAALREKALERFEAYLAVAPSFGCRIVASETGSVDPAFRYTEDNFTEEAYLAAEASIARLVRTAERAGTVVGIEPGVNHPIHDIETMGRLLARIDSPCLGVVLDPTALITPGTAPRQLEMVREALARFGDRVVATHLVDYRVAGEAIERCDIGEGVLDVAGVLSAVEAARPAGYVITEFTEGEAIAHALRTWERFA